MLLKLIYFYRPGYQGISNSNTADPGSRKGGHFGKKGGSRRYSQGYGPLDDILSSGTTKSDMEDASAFRFSGSGGFGSSGSFSSKGGFGSKSGFGNSGGFGSNNAFGANEGFGSVGGFKTNSNVRKNSHKESLPSVFLRNRGVHKKYN